MATELIDTEFKAVGMPTYRRALGSIGDAASSAGRSLQGMLGFINPTNAALGALAGVGGSLALRSLGQLGSQFENVQTRMAGTLNALEFTKDFGTGLQAAEAVMNKINAAAAALPGEAEDYVEVFTQALPVVSKAVGGSLENMTAFTNRYTAIARSLQVDAMQAARDLTLMLREGVGAAGMDVRTFTQFLPLMKQVEGYADLTRESFNKLNEVQRAGLLEKTLARMDPMLQHAAGSWDAVTGSVATTTRLVTRLGSAPLFDAMVTQMGRLNSAVVDGNGELTAFGRSLQNIGNVISTHLAGGMERAVGAAVDLAANFDGLLTRVQQLPAVQFIDQLLGRLEGLATSNILGGGAVGMLLAGPIGALLGAAAGFENVMRVAGVVGDLLGQIAEAAWPVVEALGSTLSSVIDSLLPVFESLGPVVGAVFEAMFQFVVAVAPLVDALASIVGALAPILGIVTLIFTGWKLIFEHILKPILDLAADALSGFGMIVKLTADFVAMMGRFFTMSGEEFDAHQKENRERWGPGANQTSAAGPLGPLGALIESLKGTHAEQKKYMDIGGLKAPDRLGVKAPGQRGGAKVTQDFRGSRFTIQQDFKEGFDPDRIAVAFAKDVGKIAAQRLQSGFEPLFAVR